MIALALALLAATPDAAAPPPEPLKTRVTAPAAEATCLTYDRRYAAAPLMLVRRAPTGRVRLQDRAVPCYEGRICSWVRAAYLVPGDVVLAGAPDHGFRCVYVGAAGRLTAGFVPDAALTPAATDAAPITPAWLAGRWRDGDDEIVFKPTPAGIKADGEAIWPGRDIPGPPGPNVGEFHAIADLVGDRMAMRDDVCRVEARRRGPYLVVTDNDECGGMNVRFYGLYVRAR